MSLKEDHLEDIEIIQDFSGFSNQYQIEQDIERNGVYIGIHKPEKVKYAIVGYLTNNNVRIPVYLAGEGEFDVIE